jgi:hypothetical protein
MRANSSRSKAFKNNALLYKTVSGANRFIIGRDGSRDEVIAKYERWLADQHNLLRVLDELRGRDLLCFCIC